MSQDTVTVTLEADGKTDELALPVALLDQLSGTDKTSLDVVSDMATLALTQQAHGLVHHGHGKAGTDLEDAEEVMLDLFEERFGRTFAEMTGHDH